MTLLLQKAKDYLQQLCVTIIDRSVGNNGNQQATKFFSDTIQTFSFKTETPEFECIDWMDHGSTLTVDGKSFKVKTGPYTVKCKSKAILCTARDIQSLRNLDASGKIILLMGEIAKEQLMPKSFPFYNPDEHEEIRQLLENSGAIAIITATGRNPELAGGMYPFPMIEDGDFTVPSVYMTDIEGIELEKYTGSSINLEIGSEKIPSKGCNVIASKGNNPNERIILCAHIDSKKGTPGAIDNASGIIVLLLLAEMLRNYSGEAMIEIVALNGEDYYSIPGQLQYLDLNKDKFNSIKLVINLDGAGYFTEKTAYSFYNCPFEIEQIVKSSFQNNPELMEGPQWIQSDHGMFVQMGIPAIAITSNNFMEELSVNITHTAKDNIDIVDCSKLVTIAMKLKEVILALKR